MSDDQTPVVTITPAEMYGELRGVRESVSHIEGKLDGFATINDQEERIRRLEVNRWPWPAIVTLAAVAAAFAAAWQLTARS
ncbi:hypothetical protein [Streptomyces sp. NPDC053427]|uniref:hypothetical protein n=1 Tax=Streptomyces sp. NPDC053427 TaxID=3365701 RepID=UPI0037D8D638